MKPKTKEALLITGVAVAFTAVGFLIGLSAGSKKEKRMVVTSKGELTKEEVD